MSEVLIYGSYGYSGALIAKEAVAQSFDVALAGRDEKKVTDQAEELGTASYVFSLDERAAMENALSDVELVIHCAGPFINTFEPMVNACIKTGTHYLDLTGETKVFRSLADRNEAAEDAEVMLMPGTAFDVVPTDCLAAYLHERLPTATNLVLGFDIMPAWEIAGGTIATAIENIPNDDAGVFLGNTIVRRDGAIEIHPPGWKSREIDFGYATKTGVTIPWGDIVTAHYTTNIPNITVYAALSTPERLLLKSVRYIKWLYEFDLFRTIVRKSVQRFKSGQSGSVRAQDQSGVWGRAWNDSGDGMEARLIGPGGYDIVAQAPLVIANRILSNNLHIGFQTPAGAYGPDLVLEIDGVTRQDLQ